MGRVTQANGSPAASAVVSWAVMFVTAMAPASTTLTVIAGPGASADILVIMTVPTLSVAIVDMEEVYQFLPLDAPLGDGMNVAYEFNTTSPDIMVVAATHGVGAQIGVQPETGDSEIITRTAGSAWYTSYDHVKDVQVPVGDMVEAGTVLGTVGPWQLDPQTLRGPVGIQIGYSEHVVCPRLLGTPAFNAPDAAALARIGADQDDCVMERFEQEG